MRSRDRGAGGHDIDLTVYKTAEERILPGEHLPARHPHALPRSPGGYELVLQPLRDARVQVVAAQTRLPMISTENSFENRSFSSKTLEQSTILKYFIENLRKAALPPAVGTNSFSSHFAMHVSQSLPPKRGSPEEAITSTTPRPSPVTLVIFEGGAKMPQVPSGRLKMVVPL